uniref:Uncharacterized protein n=1 Tax=Megaselia scalaris TaxID=36166 RepID=T1GQH0_MEGSC
MSEEEDCVLLDDDKNYKSITTVVYVNILAKIDFEVHISLQMKSIFYWINFYQKLVTILLL